jgi:hypothetical protein
VAEVQQPESKQRGKLGGGAGSSVLLGIWIGEGGRTQLKCFGEGTFDEKIVNCGGDLQLWREFVLTLRRMCGLGHAQQRSVVYPHPTQGDRCDCGFAGSGGEGDGGKKLCGR